MNTPSLVLKNLLITSIWLATFWHAPAFAAELLDRVVAIVNDEVITFSDLNREGAPLFRRITKEAPPHQIEATLLKAREDLLASLVDKMIVEQRAKKLGITVGKPEIDEALNRLVARNNTSPEKFRQQIAGMGATEEDYRAVVRSQLIQDRLIDYEIRSRVVINEERIRQYYEKNYLAQAKEGAYHLLQIGLSAVDTGPSAMAETRKKAEAVRELAVAGQDFRALARQHSTLPSAQDGGDIGIFKKADLSAKMQANLVNLQPGQISPIEEMSTGYQFFKLLSDKGDVRFQAGYDAVKDDIRQRLLEEGLNSQFQKWVKELRDEAYIKKLL